MKRLLELQSRRHKKHLQRITIKDTKDSLSLHLVHQT